MRLADMLAHYAQGQAVAPDQLLAVARRSGSARRTCARCCSSCPARRPTASAPRRPARSRRASWRFCKRLAEGKVYKQIALELGLSTSTVRTHLHNVYGKLGAVDRAQAVLIASERGWL